MYKIYLKDQGEKYPLYEPLDDELRVFSPVLTQEMGKAGYFEFHMMADHPYADKLGLLRTEVIVYEDDREIFHGRVLKPEYDIQNLISVTCEGDFTYLIDSQQRPFEMESDIPTFMAKLLETHNNQVDDFKKMFPGRITVTDESSVMLRKNTKFSTTQELLKTLLSDIHGGYFRVRNEDGTKYLDYLWDYGGINEQTVRFGENLLELNKYMDATSIITCLIPLGADVEYKDDLGELQVKTVDITSVNDGVDYLQDDAGVEMYGKVWGTYKWSEVTVPEDLLAKAKKYLQEASALPVAMEVNALDLSLIDDSLHRFELGYWTQIVSEPHGIDRRLMLTKRVINLLDPTAGSITLGKPAETFVDQAVKAQKEASKAVDKVAQSASSEINRKVENATNLITGGLGGYVVLDNIDPNTGEKVHPWRVLIMNTPDKETATNVIQLNQNGIGFSTTGINGPYTNAWTIDGNMVADFITTGTLLADRVRGGTLEVGGKGLAKDGKIAVKDAQDRQIGYWDKTGLHVLRGEIEGSTIRGSNIIGGSILGATIDVGVFSADGDSANFGDFYVSDLNGRNVIRSKDGSVLLSEDTSKASSLFFVGGSGSDSPFRVSAAKRIAYAQDIYLYNTGYGFDWTVAECIKDLYNITTELKNAVANK